MAVELSEIKTNKGGTEDLYAPLIVITGAI